MNQITRIVRLFVHRCWIGIDAQEPAKRKLDLPRLASALKNWKNTGDCGQTKPISTINLHYIESFHEVENLWLPARPKYFAKAWKVVVARFDSFAQKLKIFGFEYKSFFSCLATNVNQNVEKPLSHAVQGGTELSDCFDEPRQVTLGCPVLNDFHVLFRQRLRHGWPDGK